MDLTTVEKNLEERGFKVSAFATAKEAADYLNAQIDGESVSFGGSMTLSQMGLFESLGKHNKMFSHSGGWRRTAADAPHPCSRPCRAGASRPCRA